MLFEFGQEYKFKTILYKILKRSCYEINKRGKRKINGAYADSWSKRFWIKKLKEEILEVNEEIEKLKKELEEDE